MTDPRHAPDTLFFVAEEDWRLFPEDEGIDAEVVAKQVFEDAGGASSTSAFAETVNQGSTQVKVSLTRAYDITTGEPFAPERNTGRAQGSDSAGVEPAQPGREKSAGSFYRRPAKPSVKKEEDTKPGRHLEYLVKMVTLAHCTDVGDFVWLTWCGRSQRGGRAKPSNGTMLVAVSVAGAQALAAAGEEGKIPEGRLFHYFPCLCVSRVVHLQCPICMMDRCAQAAHTVRASGIVPERGGNVYERIGVTSTGCWRRHTKGACRAKCIILSCMQ